MLYENRWGVDPAITTPAYLRRFSVLDDPDAFVDVCTYASTPAAGGLISGRGFLDLRITRRVERKAPDGTVLVEFWSPSVGPPEEELGIDALGARQYLALVSAQKLVRGLNIHGSGLVIAEALDERGERRVDVNILASCEVGGGLPISIVNGASAGALLGACLAIAKVLAKMAPGSQLLTKAK